LTMRPNLKFIRVVLGATVGAALWAGCATQRDVIYEPSGASVRQEREVRIDRQDDMTKWGADTHPEWRTGWNMTFPNPPHGAMYPEEMSTSVDLSQPPQAR
jgi:hypothetical protein